jgi:hypothetical protein
MWSALLGDPFSASKTPVTIGLIYGDQALEYRVVDKDKEAPAAKIVLVKFNGGLMFLGIFGVVLVIGGVFCLGMKTPMLRDSGQVPQIPPMKRLFSLGRCQMAVWFCLILSSFLFIFVILWDLNSLNAESFVLLGISASTALGAIAIDHSKDAIPAQVEANLVTMGLKTQADVEKLDKQVNQVNQGGRAAADTVIAGAAVAGFTNPTAQNLWDAYELETRNFRSQGFFRDLINDATGPTLHRFQIIVWTLVLATIYIGLVYLRLETPTFGNNLLALMGITGGVYLGFKIPEKQN